MSVRHSKQTLSAFRNGSRKDTCPMSSRELADYMARQRNNGWPGSTSIHGYALHSVGRKANKKEKRDENVALDTGFNQ